MDVHVVLRRVGSEKLGLKLAAVDNAFQIISITGRWIKEMNMRCRSCCIKQVLDCQLMVGDHVVCVNGRGEMPDMLEEFSNFDVECLHLRVRRYLPRCLSESQTGDLTASEGVLARVIQNYNCRSEPETGYLSVSEGTVVMFRPCSRAPSEAGNGFQCDYIFAWETEHGLSRGWLPLDVLSVRNLWWSRVEQSGAEQS